MPMIVAKIDTITNMRTHLRNSLRKAGIPEYSYKDRRAGFEVWHAERNEGETRILWRTFTEDEAATAAEQRVGLETCAAYLQEHYWIKLDIPAPLRYLEVNQPTLRVLLRLSWLS